MERKFINAFQDRFRNEPVIIQTGSCLEFLKKCDGPVILICLCLSRLLSDVKYTLDGVEGNVLSVYFTQNINTGLQNRKNTRPYYSYKSIL